MKLVLMGFDTRTEALSEDWDITPIGIETAADILQISVEEFVGDFELDELQLEKISELTELSLNPAKCEYFLGLRAD